MALRIVLIICILIEIILHSDFIPIPFNAHLRPLLIALTGLVIGWIGIVQSKGKQIFHFTHTGLQSYSKYIAPLLGVVACIFIYATIDGVISSSPVSLEESDIIPTLQVLVDRFLNGEQVYRPVDFGSWQVIPGYMPMQWMPYSIAALLDFDFRWIPYLTLGGIILLLSKKALHNPDRIISTILIIGLLLLLFYSIQATQHKMYLTTVEWTIASFYILLCLYLNSKKYWVIGIVLFLCLFSRYSLLFWLVPMALVFWNQHTLKFNLSIAGVVISLALLTYFIPYFFQDPTIFTNGLDYYNLATTRGWTPRPWIAPGMPPDHIGLGYGFAFYFWEYLDHLPIADRVISCIWTHRIVSLGSAVALSYYYIKFQKQIIHSSIFLLAALKIYFVFFYGFIQIPYLYLMVVPLVVSFMMLYIRSDSQLQS